MTYLDLILKCILEYRSSYSRSTVNKRHIPMQCQQKSLICHEVNGETLFRWTIHKPGKHSLWSKLIMCSPKINGKSAYVKKVPTLGPDWSIFIQMRNPNSYSLIGSRNTILIARNLASWLVIMEPLWLVGKGAKKAITVQLQLGGAGLSPLVKKKIPGTPLLGLTETAGTLYRSLGSSVCGFSMKCSMGEEF